MLMPETTVDKNHLTQAWEDKVWLACKVGAVKPEAIAHLVRKTAHEHLRFHSLALDLSHVGRAPLGTYPIHKLPLL